MISTTHLAVLRKIRERLDGTDVNWVLTGSLAFALQDIAIAVNDIDIQTDKAGAHEIERLFADFVKRKVRLSTTDKVCSHFGALNMDGIDVEIMGDVQKRLADDSWEAPVDLNRHKRFIPFEDGEVPVLSLAYEREAYLKMGRVETAALLERWLDERSQS